MIRTPPAVALAVLLVLAGCLGAPGEAATRPDTSTATAPGPTLAPGSGVEATVTRVVDGDTIEVELANGTVEKIRMVGVDTPEVYSENDPAEYGVPDTEAGRACLREWGERASEFASDYLAGRSVRLVFDGNLPRRGYYGRLLAYVYVDGHSFDHWLIATGHARVFRSDFTERGAYEATQREARVQDRGLWECAADGPTATPEGSVVDVGLSLAAVHEDAAGNDNDNPNDEYVTIENAGTANLDLSGWTVRDGAGHTYRFPDGTVLEPGDRVTLHTGTGSDGGGHLYWGRTRAVWNNGGDVVVVVDDAGRTVLREPY